MVEISKELYANILKRDSKFFIENLQNCMHYHIYSTTGEKLTKSVCKSTNIANYYIHDINL